MDPELLLRLLDYAWVVLFAGAAWVIKLGGRMTALEREILAMNQRRVEDDKRRDVQRREMLDTIAANHTITTTKLDRLVEKILTE